MASMLAILAASATAAVQTQTWVGQEDGPTPDIYRSDIAAFFNPDGSPASLIGQAGTINLTLDGTHVVTFCVESNSGFNLGTVSADVQAQPMDSAVNRAIAYVVLKSTVTGPPTATKEQTAAVGQVATWVLDGDLRESGPTSDAALNADVAALVAEARSATATPASLALAAAAPAPGATTSTITVTGRPGAVVDLAVTAGTGSLSAPQVTLGSTGTATVSLTAPGPGTVTVGASAAGDGILYRVNPLDQSQSTGYAVPTTLSESVTVAFQAAPTPTTPTTPATPTVPVTGGPATANLRVTKTGPRRALVLRRVAYRIVIRNTSRRAANGVVLRDRIPRGLVFVRASRRSSVRNRDVVVRIGRIPAGATRRVVIFMRATSNVRGRRTNVVRVNGTNVSRRVARAGTVFRSLPRRIQPAVTG